MDNAKYALKTNVILSNLTIKLRFGDNNPNGQDDKNISSRYRMEDHRAETCAACIQHEKHCKEVARSDIRDFDKNYKLITDIWKRNCPMWANKYHLGNGKPKGLFAGTLTMSKDDKYNEEDMIYAIKKIMVQETCPVEKYAWYLEYQDNGSPHIHFIYRTKTEGRIHAKVFKRYWKIWDESKKLGKGFRGGYHSKVDSETAYLEYIEKDGGRHQSNWI